MRKGGNGEWTFLAFGSLAGQRGAGAGGGIVISGNDPSRRPGFRAESSSTYPSAIHFSSVLVCLKPGGPFWARRNNLLKCLVPKLPTIQAPMSLHRPGLCGGDGSTGWGRLGDRAWADQCNCLSTVYGVCAVDQTLWGPQTLEEKGAALSERGTQMGVGKETNSVS